MNRVEEHAQLLREPAERNAALLLRVVLGAVAPNQNGGLRIDVAWTDLDPHRYTAQIPFGILPARLLIAVVDFHAKAGLAQSFRCILTRRDRAVVALAHDRHEHRFDRRHLRRNA